MATLLLDRLEHTVADAALRPLDAETQQQRDQWPVALVTMPFISITRPSIQIGLLKSIGAAHGFPVSTFHLNLDFAARIGPTLYEKLCEHRGHMFGDWLFSAAAFGAAAPDPDDELLHTFSKAVERMVGEVDETPERLATLRRVDAQAYVEDLATSITWDAYRIVGFTTTFQQSVASFALATRIKQLYPDIQVLFGGANFEGEMGLELLRAVPSVDLAVIGEGDRAFPELLVALSEGRDPATVPGVVRRDGNGVTALRRRPPFSRLNDLPPPDYDEYFERAERLGLLDPGGRRRVFLPFEGARGCWWGQKNHCTFCGLNGAEIGFRAKSPDRVLEELAILSQRHRSFQFEAVDNILDLAYLKDFFPALISAGTDYEFFYEVKSNLTREKIRLLSEGGVRQMQPGIESVNSHVLRLMRKGVRAIQNVNTLRWGLYYGIRIGWNLLWGFPNETPEDYAEQVALLKRIRHLQPPSGAGRIWMERFSPIFYDREAFPVRSIQPEMSYRYVYPPTVNLDKVAYFFDYELESTLPDDVYEETGAVIRAWQDQWKSNVRPTLTFWSAPHMLLIEDLREPEVPGTHKFTGPLAGLYVSCSNEPHSAQQLRETHELPWPVSEIEQALDEFCARGLMMRDGNLFLSLALPAVRGR